MSVLALFAVTVDESDEAFANVYSTAVSLQNVMPRVSQRLLIVASAVVATAGALVLDLSDFATFLFLLGSFFVPLLGVLIADWLLEGRRYTRDTIFHGPAFRPEMILAWIVGFGLFQWLSPQGPAWWTRLSATPTRRRSTSPPRCRASSPRSGWPRWRACSSRAAGARVRRDLTLLAFRHGRTSAG